MYEHIGYLHVPSWRTALCFTLMVSHRRMPDSTGTNENGAGHHGTGLGALGTLDRVL